MKSKRKLYLSIMGFFLMINIKVYAGIFSDSDMVMVTSVSSDGHYAVTSGTDKRITLWDLKDHKAKIISVDGNIYSAYFIKHTDKFIWQDLKQNEVYVEDVNGTIVKKFNPGFPSYGEVMTTDLQYYIASNDNWHLFIVHGGQVKEMMQEDEGGFIGAGKLINLMFTSDDQHLLTAGIGTGSANPPSTRKNENVGFDDITLWNYRALKPLTQYIGNEAKEVAAISPDDHYVIGGDEAGIIHIWNLQGIKLLFDLDDLKFGHDIKRTKTGWAYSTKGLISMPPEFGWRIDMAGTPYYHDKMGIYDAVFSIKFIDKDHYLRFTTYTPWAILYKVTDPQPTKYINLGKDPYPSMVDYIADESIDTSPSAHILVTGQYYGDGIIEYQYDPKTQNLTRVWAPSAPSFLAKSFWVSK